MVNYLELSKVHLELAKVAWEKRNDNVYFINATYGNLAKSILCTCHSLMLELLPTTSITTVMQLLPSDVYKEKCIAELLYNVAELDKWLDTENDSVAISGNMDDVEETVLNLFTLCVEILEYAIKRKAEENDPDSLRNQVDNILRDIGSTYSYEDVFSYIPQDMSMTDNQLVCIVRNAVSIHMRDEDI